jgi:hypothetical protein
MACWCRHRGEVEVQPDRICYLGGRRMCVGSTMLRLLNYQERPIAGGQVGLGAGKSRLLTGFDPRTVVGRKLSLTKVMPWVWKRECRQIWVAVSGSNSPTHLGLKLLALCAPPLVPPVISRGAPRQATWETSVSEERSYGREMAGQFCLQFRLPRKSQGSFEMPQICDMGQTALLPVRRTACCGFFRFGRVRTRDLGYQRPAC